MNYEEKYKNALERAKSFCKRWDGLNIDSSSLVIQEVKEFFPELDNLEDEIMRENLYKCLRCYVPNDKAEEFIAWLEKQGEKKSADKTTSKFKVGDWIVGNDGIFKITQYEDEYGYELTDTTGYVAHFISPDYVESNFHLWNIQDAKVGDVLVDEDSNIGIYVEEKDDLYWHPCIYLGCDGYLHGFITVGYLYCKNTKPATKEQRDLLFQQMKEAGYEWEWDAEKKELKKIESKTLDADKVIAWLVANICDFEYYVKLFKKDFGL